MGAHPAVLAFVSLLISCADERVGEKRFFSFIINSEWDSVRSHLDKPVEDLVLILNSRCRLERVYDFSFVDGRLLLRLPAGVVDTIVYSWNDQHQLVTIDTTEVLKLFSMEERIRNDLVLHFIEIRKPKKALQWLTKVPRLEIDSLYGELFGRTAYALDIKEFGKAIPSVERAWNDGHLLSGLALSSWYTMSGERERGVDILKRLALLKNSEAMVRLGDIYDMYGTEFGYHPPNDAKPESSFQWFKAAAQLSNSYAMYKLGNIYERGINRKKSLDSAMYWYRQSSDHGESISSSTIALFYLRGDIVRQNVGEGMQWMQKAVRQDLASGYFELGTVYEKGIGVEPDLARAHEYYSKADSAGYPVAKRAIQKLLNPIKERRRR
jgi:TPR repeat protein